MTDPALDYLFGLTMHGVKLGLANIRALLDAAGNPQDTYPTIHVAGTNGKGSTVAMLDAMFRAAGYRVGRFTSPHLVRLNERFQINGEQIPDADLREEIDFFRAIAAERDYPPTFFELNTAMAFRWFARERVDAAIIEVGLGGRLDSTNVLHPISTAVTNIDLEHTQYLGHTLEEIAYEKAGIFKKDTPAVIGEVKSGPRGVLLARARHEGAPALLLERDFTYTLSGPPLNQRISYESATLEIDDAPLALRGAFQGPNAAMAIALAEQCAPRFPRLTREAILHGLATATWPCRLEKVRDTPPVYIDVAHNPAGARQLAEAFAGQKCIIVIAVSADKDAPSMLAHLAPIAQEFIVTAYEGPRAMAVEELAGIARMHRETREIPRAEDAVNAALERAMPDINVLVTGSIFLAGEAKQALQ